MRTSMLAECLQYMDELEIAMVDAVQDWVAAGCPAYFASKITPESLWRFEICHGNGWPLLRYHRRAYMPNAGLTVWTGPLNWRTDKDRLHPLEAVSRVLDECRLQREQELLEAP